MFYFAANRKRMDVLHRKTNPTFSPSLKKWHDLARLGGCHLQATISCRLITAGNFSFATVSTTPCGAPDTKGKYQLLFYLIAVKRTAEVLYLHAYQMCGYGGSRGGGQREPYFTHLDYLVGRWEHLELLP